MIMESLPEWFGEADEFLATKRDVLRHATRVISISQASADDLARAYPDCTAKTVVAHLGADHLPEVPAADLVREIPPADPYVLFVGDRLRYKNFRIVIEALASSGWPRGTTLRVTGRPFSDWEQLLLERLGVARRVSHAGHVPDQQLSGLYTGAAAMVFPSLAEGFGLPLIESQRRGCPVICSDIPVFRELAGPSVVYFDPRDVRSVAGAADRVLDPAVRGELLTLGVSNARRFTWARCAGQMAAAYRQALA